MEIDEQLAQLQAIYEEVAAEYGEKMNRLPAMAQNDEVSAADFRHAFAEASQLAARLAELRRMMKLLLHHNGKARSDLNEEHDLLIDHVDRHDGYEG